MLNLLIVANESAGVRVIRDVIKLPVRVVGVLTFDTSQQPNSVTKVAVRLKLDTLKGELVKNPDFASFIRQQSVDIAINIHAPAIFCQEVLDAPKYGCFNLHPGPLPRYAGLNPVSWAIYNGETKYGTTVHKMKKEIDAGSIAYQSIFPINETETALSLMTKCILRGVPLITRLIKDGIENPAKIPCLPQDKEERQYFSKQIPNQGKLDFHCSAEQILRFIRACDFGPYSSIWGYPYIPLNNKKVEVISASSVNKKNAARPGTVKVLESGEVHIAAYDKWISIDKIKVGNGFIEPREYFQNISNLDV
jgi:methionyl-tRNA formyltransferase